jgi:hypothetical protein
LPPLCLSLDRRQRDRSWDAVKAPVWSSVGSAVAHCVHEYKNSDNVHTGQRSQELTFDFVQAEAGIYRQAQTIAGHRYRIEAWGKHIRSVAAVELSLGVDLSGGKDWRSSSVSWYPWDGRQESAWVHTQVVVRASGNTLTVFLKGYHPSAVQGGATLFDNVRVVDLGP